METQKDNAELCGVTMRRRFDWAAAHFDSADFVHTVTRDGLFARLDPMLIDAKTIVDLGCATGSACRPLKQRFRKAHIIGVDLSSNMLEQARSKQSWFAKSSLLRGNAAALPLADQTVDIVFANLLMPWISSPSSVFDEVARVLRKDGLFLFSTLGPDSLLELRRAWQIADPGGAHVNQFLDMHDIGDAAVRAGLRDPVLDVDRLSLAYENSDALFRDLSAVGGRNSLKQRGRSLAGKARFAKMTDALHQSMNDGVMTLELELVYGHCWGSGPLARDGEFRIDANQIGRIRR